MCSVHSRCERTAHHNHCTHRQQQQTRRNWFENYSVKFIFRQARLDGIEIEVLWIFREIIHLKVLPWKSSSCSFSFTPLITQSINSHFSPFRAALVKLFIWETSPIKGRNEKLWLMLFFVLLAILMALCDGEFLLKNFHVTSKWTTMESYGETWDNPW